MTTPASKTRWLTVFLAAACLTVPAVGQAVPDTEPKPPPPVVQPPSPASDSTVPEAAPAPAPTPIDVELELALLVDASSSVDDREFALQRQGYVDAFRDPEVQAAIVALDGVVVSYWEWSSYRQRSSFGDRLLKTEADCETMARLIEAFDRHYAHSTNMAYAIQGAIWRQKNNRYVSQRHVIDISGDGVCENEFAYRDGRSRDTSLDLGPRWQDVRSWVIDGTVINAISIGSDEDLNNWYASTLPLGPGSFAMNALTFEAFGEAIKQKLLREIVKTPVAYD